MKRQQNNWVGFVILLLVVLLAMTVFPDLFGMSKRARQIARRTQVRADIANYTKAVAAYSNKFGTLPLGNNRSVTPLLMGSNSQRLIFIAFPNESKRLNHHGEFLDPDGNPYAIEVITNAIRITQRPK